MKREMKTLNLERREEEMSEPLAQVGPDQPAGQ